MKNLSFNENEALDKIKETILNRYPIVEDRLMKLLDQYPRKQLDIYVDLYKPEDISQISLLDTTNSFSQTTDKIEINRLLSDSTIVKLFDFIISDHDCVKRIYLDSSYRETIKRFESSLNFVFAVDFGLSNELGMCLDDINLKINFSDKEDCDNLVYSYLNSIVKTFYDKIKNTAFVREYFKEYCQNVKEEFIKSLNDVELYKFIGLLDTKELIKIIYGMSNDLFIEKYNEFLEVEGKESTKVKRIIQRM